jgi:Spy/CpxP family protein refolding chaperone
VEATNLKKLRTLLALTGALVVVAASQAQGFRMMGTPGGAGGMKSMVMFRMDMQGASVRSDVAKELKITDEQKDKLMKVQDDQRQKMMSMFQGGGFDPSDREKMQKVISEAMAEADKSALAVLDEAQKKRLNELWIQRMGNGAIAVPEVQKQLGLTEAQVTKIKDLQTKQQSANQALFEKVRNQEIDPQEMRDVMTKNTKILNDEYAKVLTTEQTAKLKTLGGAEFKFDPDNR